MAITLDGSGSVTGISVGGLPDGIVDTDMIAANAVTAAKRGAGAILQVKQTVKTDTFVSSSLSGGAVSGAAISINFAALSTSNKLYITSNLMVANSVSSTQRIGSILYAGGSVVTDAVGDASGNKTRISMGAMTTSDNLYSCISHSCLITPTSTNTITYDYRLHNGAGDNGVLLYMNRCHNESDNSFMGRGCSSITIMEVSA